jgi:hypothetical protein
MPGAGLTWGTQFSIMKGGRKFNARCLEKNLCAVRLCKGFVELIPVTVGKV